ncbi:Conserved_hypothetical protein [Hexamita inflata]|uniref:Uncharacterized protein n=1 Tax=Hexamita inflata TaxID=28002 RepID=A0AA86U0B0_9EUKA|nr:Conserved hypothetical protein [Hexamita inflata]
MIIEPKESVVVQLSFIQFRISSLNSSGLVNVIKYYTVTYINQCSLTGSNLVQSNNNGYIASTIFVNILLNITQFNICVDKTSRFGYFSVQFSTIGSDSVQCDLCQQLSVVYGLCGEVIKFSENVNGMYQCVYPLEFVDNKCVCVTGYLLNKTKCINIVESINSISDQISNSSNDQIIKLVQIIDQIENTLTVIDQSISSNMSEIESRILSNFSKSDLNMLMNTAELDNRIYQNITSIQNDIIMKYITADANLLTNTTVLDWRIFNNISQLQNFMNNFTLYYNNSLNKQQLIIEQQQNIINNLTQQINCSSNSGYSMINGTCVQVSCAISGQQSINGICQCVNINSIVQSGSCVCPENSQVVGIACVCSTSGQSMINGKCTCSTAGAIIQNNACTCGSNSINISNTCSCPSGASLVNGVCTCSNVNAYISGNSCVCPTYSLLVGNICTCPSNSQIVNNECICNVITGQIMNSGVCQCQTTGAFVNYGVCSCAVNAINISNTCTCPTNSSLTNNVCTCDQIVGQSIVNGTCQCPAGQSIVNQTCKQINYEINITNFKCSQELFTQQFDIQSITNQISVQNNFSNGFVFSTFTVIQNAFIDISDNVYSTTIYPLFQSQNIYTNFKIQFGTQSLSSGSFILSSNSLITIQQMNIISRPGSQLTVNSLLNIITSSTISANITNLFVNLSFAPSSGNITLIQNINGILNIMGYQVLGSYVSTSSVAMIASNLNAATIYVNQVSLKVDAFNVGNCSSYLFSNAVTTTSIITVNMFAVIIGNTSNFLLLGSIATSSQNTFYYLFGGIIAYINSNSIVNINNVIMDSYLKFSSNYVSYSGFLVGNIDSLNSSINTKNICLQQNMTSTTIQFQFFGLIGRNYGNTSIINASVSFSVQGVYFYCLGIIGYQNIQSVYSEVINVTSSATFISTTGRYLGSIFGADEGKNCSVLNTTVFGGNISGYERIGGFSGQHYNANITIQNSLISNMSISGTYNVGGIVGISYTNENTYLINSKIQTTRISGSSNFGIVAGYVESHIYLTNSSSTQNYVNAVQQKECAVLSNWQSGC